VLLPSWNPQLEALATFFTKTTPKPLTITALGRSVNSTLSSFSPLLPSRWASTLTAFVVCLLDDHRKHPLQRSFFFFFDFTWLLCIF
jgi:hypothetical protein